MTAKTSRRKSPGARSRTAKKPSRRPARATRASSPPEPIKDQAVATVPAHLTQPSKQARLIALVQSESGATMAQLQELTGWQRHTLRGHISGALRKRLGLNVVSTAREEDGVRTYRLLAPGAPA